ncbi:MAG: hypothetical protein JXR22_04975 [Prolixibacteraceae bacterium]|nr:hypothetical protein [Prolixibacteraceae bacterium]
MKTLEKIYREFISTFEEALRVVITTKTIDFQFIPIPVARRTPPKKR